MECLLSPELSPESRLMNYGLNPYSNGMLTQQGGESADGFVCVLS